MTRLTPDERRAIELELDDLRAELVRLQALLDASPVAGDDTIRMLPAFCACGLPRGHRHPSCGEPTPCADETAKIALHRPGRPPVPHLRSVTGDESTGGER